MTHHHARMLSSLRTLAIFTGFGAVASCTPPPDDAVSIRLPSQLQALSAEAAGALRATVEIPGVLAESELAIADDLSEASGRFTVNVTAAATHPFIFRITYAPEGEQPAVVGTLAGDVTIAPNVENKLATDGDFDTCGAAAAGEPCAVAFDLNRNGFSNLEDLLNDIDPYPAPPFIDVAPDDLPFPSGIRLGTFARQVIVVENVTSRSIRVKTTLVDAPGVTLSLYETNFNPANSAQRSLDLGELQPFQEVLVAVSFAPVNAFLTVGDIFVEATDDSGPGATHVRQAQRVRLLANADGELQPPPPDFAPAAIAAVDLGGFPIDSVETFDTASLFNGLAVTNVTTADGAVPGLPYTGRTIAATFLEPDGQGGAVEAAGRVPADAAFLVEVLPGHKLSASLSGLETDIDLAMFLLDDTDSISTDAAQNVRVAKAGTSAEALEHRNEKDAAERILLVIGRVESEPPEGEGALTVDDPAPFALSAHTTAAPEFTRPPDPLGGPLEGGNRVKLYGRGFNGNAQVTFADAVALDCTLADADGDQGDEEVLDCTAPAGSLIVGKNPATIVVANPGRDDGGDGQAATLPEGYAFEPPAPRLDSTVPNIAPTQGSATVITLAGAFFSRRNGVPEVTFGNVVATDVQFIDSTKIQMLAPAQAAPGIVSVSVRNILDRAPGDPEDLVRFSLPSNVRNFTYVTPDQPAPTLTAIEPARVPTDGGALVTLTGTGFQQGAQVILDGTVGATVTFISSTSLAVVTPARDAPGFVDVDLVNPDGQSVGLDGGLEFFVPNPEVIGVFPDQAATAGGTFVVIDGRGFRAGIVAEFVSAADVVVPSANVNRVSTTTLLVATPSVPSGGDYALRVRNVDGQTAQYAGTFRFLEPEGAPPRIDLIDPNIGDKDVPPLVTLRGAEFRNPAVLVGAANATLVEVSTDGDVDVITFFPPAVANAGPAVVRVINSDGQSDTAVFNYVTTLGAPPVIDTVFPNSASRGQLITITGRNFNVVGSALDPAARLIIGGRLLTPQTASSTTLTALVPDLDSVVNNGTVVAVELINADGQTTSASFVYVVNDETPAPIITNVTPQAAAVGDRVTITGSSFDLALLQVGATAFTATSPAIVTNTATTIAFNLPAGAGTPPSSALLRITNAGGATVATTIALVAPFVAAPRIDAIAPDKGAPTGGAAVTLTGSGFTTGGTLRVGSATVTPSSVTATGIAFTTPAVAADSTVAVTWTNPDGQSAQTTFRYETPLVVNGDPAIGFLSPSQVHALVPGDTITLVGANLNVVTSATIQQIGGGTFAATIVGRTDVSVTVRVDGALPDSVDANRLYQVRLGHPGGNVTSPPFEARKPRVTLTLEQGADELIFIGEFFNPDRLDPAAVLLDNGLGSVIPLVVDSASESFMSVRRTASLVPGSIYNLALTYDNAGVSVDITAGAGADGAFQAFSLPIFRSAAFLPAGSDLEGVNLVVNAPGSSNPQFGTPTTFELIDVTGATVGGGAWSFAGFESAALTFDATSDLPIGEYGVRLATTFSPAIAEGVDVVFLQPRAVFSVSSAPILTGVPLDGNGLFLAGDRIIAQREGTAEVVTLGNAIQGAGGGAGGPGGEGPPPNGGQGLFVDLPTDALFDGNWRLCAVGANDAAVCPSGLPVVVLESSCATPIDVGAGAVLTVPLAQGLPVAQCNTFGVRRGSLLRITIAQPSLVQTRGVGNRNVDIGLALGQGLCTGGGPVGEGATFDCSNAGELSELFLAAGTYDLFVFDRDPASDGATIATVQLTTQNDLGACVAADGDGDNVTVCNFDCRDNDGTVHPGAVDGSCNLLDDDCDGRVDNIKGSCTVGGQVGVCDIGVRSCSNTTELCTQVTSPGQRAERCSDDLDNDCDGAVDELDCETIPEQHVSRFLPTNCSPPLEHGPASGDDRGGIAVTNDVMFYNGDSGLARFNALDMTGVQGPFARQDSIFSNTGNGTLYAFFSSALNRTFQDGDFGFVVDRFVPLDPANGQPALAAPPIVLSTPITFSSGSGGNGIFSGDDVVILSSSDNWFAVDLSVGEVQPLGLTQNPPHSGCETWAYWGVAEKVRPGAFAVVFVSNPSQMVRLELPSKRLTVVEQFQSLSDMCSFTALPARSRWYWHHENTSQFSSGDERAGFCDAIMCGDGVCAGGLDENAFNCPVECNPSCGDGICESPAESNASCAADCAPSCGNGLCDPGEPAGACPADCDRFGPAGFCGDGFCTQNEPVNCPQDCATPDACGNGICEPLLDESRTSCPVDCSCGDGVCNGNETAASCSSDCNCGDGICDESENTASCAGDCLPNTCGNNTCEPPEDGASCADDCLLTFVGPQLNVDTASLTGWTQCFTSPLNNSGPTIAAVLSQCPGNELMIACREVSQPNVLRVAAHAPRADVIFDTGTGFNTTHEANGTAWYFSDSFSWGFAPAGQPVARNSCDTNPGNDRICWHTGAGSLQGGFRCGDQNAGGTFDRVIFSANR